MANIAERIKMLRTNAGLTQEEFGNIFGIVKSTVSLYESGKSCPNDQIKLRICDYFHVPLDFLIGISNIAEFQYSDFNKGIISDGCCRSAFLDLMTIRNISIEQLVDLTGISEEVLSNWFSKEVPSLQQITLVADALKTSIDYLLGRTDIYNTPADEDKEMLSYYHQLCKMDRRWIVGQMTDMIKKYEAESDTAVAAAEPMKKAVGK